ncbi:MAG: hypothetical protein MUE44_35420 [Oscillatoriaceae cyanobacterium Prado104]|nr:hypothetical protein [Oscillatoriaceae cyanobacterium Prado104]
MLINRRKKEEGRRKKEEGRRKKEKCRFRKFLGHLERNFNEVDLILVDFNYLYFS